jgi:2-polyprenyl-3-methyl-5-hydroxy-6-metoxy-1,4-benzoquinol methylase
MKIKAVPENIFEWLATLGHLAPTPVIDTFHAVIVARAIMVATKLGVFESVASESCSLQEMAERLSVNAGVLEKLLNVLVTIGYLRFRDDRYALTRLARTWLVRSSPKSLHDHMLLRFLEWEAIEAIEDVVRTGRALDVHDRIRKDQWEVYQRGMRSLARLSAGEVARRVALAAGANRMLDIGGGHGTYSVAFCRRNPRLQSTILDLRQAVQAAAPILAEEEMGSRVVHRIGSALTEDFGEHEWDIILMSHLVHHFDEETNCNILRRAAHALRTEGVLAILDVPRQTSPNASSQTGAVLDLYFAVTSNSATWSLEQIRYWFRQAGLLPHKKISLRSAPGLVVVTAVKQGPLQP